MDEKRGYSFENIEDKIWLQAIEIRFLGIIIKCSHEKPQKNINDDSREQLNVSDINTSI